MNNTTPSFQNKRLKFAVSGSSGFVGSRLCPWLQSQGQEIIRLPRRPGNANLLEGMDAVVHLAGKNVACRWTKNSKRELQDSRIQGTRQLVEALSRMDSKPKVLICTTGIGYYGHNDKERLTEDHSAGNDFLAQTAAAHEAEAMKAGQLGIRVVTLRVGMVLDPGGGALAKMLPAFKAGLGGRLGDGRQGISWIAMEDLLRVIAFCSMHDNICGPVNTCSPLPVDNAGFTQHLARALGRPAFLPLPAWFIRLVFGEMGQALLLSGQKCQPKKLLDSGFEFLHKDLGIALKSLLRPG